MEKQSFTPFTYKPIVLEEMLAEREWRASKSSELVSSNRGTVVCMTMNIIGEHKLLPLSSAVFSTFCKLIKGALPCVHFENYNKPTGDVAYFIVNADGDYTKSICERIEDCSPVGRLFDIDVFNPDGSKLSRSQSRKCLVCDNSAKECSRNRTHGVTGVAKKTQSLILDYYGKLIGDYAHSALIDEVDTTPKPGLVDRANSGANSDMDYAMFIRSADAIAPYFSGLFKCGAMCQSLDDFRFLAQIRSLGLEAEKAMAMATNNTNTHKGAIYSLGLMSVGIGYSLAGSGTLQDAVDTAAKIALRLSETITDTNTHGIAVCKKYQVTGARGEAIGGFKTILYAFNRIKYYVDDRLLDKNNAYPLVICDIMAVMTDTNVLHRGGMEALEFMHKEAKEISQMRENQRLDDLRDLDKDFIKRNISPGGCADALACALFLINCEKLFGLD